MHEVDLAILTVKFSKKPKVTAIYTILHGWEFIFRYWNSIRIIRLLRQPKTALHVMHIRICFYSPCLLHLIKTFLGITSWTTLFSFTWSWNRCPTVIWLFVVEFRLKDFYVISFENQSKDFHSWNYQTLHFYHNLIN